jgi:CRP/FNR family transcriptional regulator/CRP/FNR family cyclic AMP-dependent transcriptional regulator
MTAMERRELLRRLHLFADLTDRESDTILDLMHEKTLGKGTTVFHQGDSGGGLYLLLTGSVKISRTGRDGRDVTVAVLHEGNFFGEMSLIDGQPRSASATTTQPTRLLVLDREHFQRYVLAQARIVAKMLRELSKRLRAADQTIENLALSSVHDRLFCLLGHLGRRAPLKDGKGLIERAPTHQELAELVGSSRETVTRTLAAFEKAGLIAIDRKKITLLPAYFRAETDRDDD